MTKKKNIFNFTRLLKTICNFQMNKNKSFYFRTEGRKQKWCNPTSPLPDLSCYSHQLIQNSPLSARGFHHSQSFGDLHTEVAASHLQPSAAYTATGRSLGVVAALSPVPARWSSLRIHLSLPEHSAPFTALSSMLHPFCVFCLKYEIESEREVPNLISHFEFSQISLLTL